MSSPKKDVASFNFVHCDASSGHSVEEQVTVDARGHITWKRDEELRIFRRSDVLGVTYVTRLSDPDEPKAVQLKGSSLFDLMAQRLPVFLAVLLSIFNIYTASVLLTVLYAWTIWQVFPKSGPDSYDMSTGPDYRTLTSSSIFSFCMMGAMALCAYWLEAELPMFMGFKPPIRRRMWLLWSNRLVLGMNGLWSLYVFVACPIAYSVTWKLDCSTDICQPGSTGVATCGVNGCTCSGLMDMSCTPAISKVGSLCASKQLPLCAPSEATETSGAQLPLLVAAVGASALGACLGLLWLVNVVVIYGTWTLESAEAQRKARQAAEVEHHRFTVSLKGSKVIFTLNAKEDPDEVINVLMPEVDMGDPLFYGENDGASTDVPEGKEEEDTEPQWC